MLQRLVANWLRQQAQEAVMNALHPDTERSADDESNPGGSTSDASESPDVDVVCLFPSAGEAGGLVDQLSNVSVTKCSCFVERVGTLDKQTIAIVESGAAHQQLAPAIRDVIQLRNPKWVLSCGFAVSLDEQVRRGSIVVADKIVDEHEYSLNTGTKMTESRGLHVGTLLTRESLPTYTEKKSIITQVSSKPRPLAVETQAAVVAEVSRLNKCPMMAIHCVAQAVNERTSNILHQLKSQDSLAGAVGAAAGALLDQPGSAREFWNDKEKTLMYSDQLAKFLIGVLTQLKPR